MRDRKKERVREMEREKEKEKIDCSVRFEFTIRYE